MTELTVVLDFACCICARSVNVTVMCAGKGLQNRNPDTVAAVNVPCPHCGAVNELYFEPTGKVRKVAAHSGPRPRLEPSLN